MRVWIAQAVGLALVSQAGAAMAQSATIMTCAIERSPAVGSSARAPVVREDRLFRVEPGYLEEWDPAEGRFGPNLCDDFTCTSDGERSEATIPAPGGAYTISIDHPTGIGFWRWVGPSRTEAKMGFCQESPDPSEPLLVAVAPLSAHGPAVSG